MRGPPGAGPADGPQGAGGPAGPGATARLLAVERGARVDGVDLGGPTLERARALTREAGLEEQVVFLHGDAERLPVPDGAYDALVCECALCTFPGKRAAAAEFARVLRPGGRVGVTDVVVEGGLPRELAGIAGWIACIADALPTTGYLELLKGAGLRVGLVERRDAALEKMIDRIEARLRVLAMTAPDRLAEAGVDAEAVAPYLEAARRAGGEAGLLGLLAEIDAGPGAAERRRADTTGTGR